MKKIITVLLMLCGILPLYAQTAADCFKALPDSISFLLTATDRADCIDFLESKMKAQVTNTFRKSSEMTHLTSDYIRMKMTSQSTWQMKLLPVNDSTQVICTVSTVCAPMCDSHIRFYTTDWKELPAADYLPEMQAPAAGNYTLLREANLSADEKLLTFTYSTPDLIEEEGKRNETSDFGASVTLRWQEGRFTP